MQLFHGFFFGLGFFASFFFFIFALIFLIKSLKKFKQTKAEVYIWEKYFKKVQDAEDYTEAQFVKQLIADKLPNEKISLPKNYVLRSKFKFAEDDQNFSGFDYKLDKWIEKIK